MKENKKIIIALDGYSACGKSTLAKSLAKELGYAFVDSGAMYRAVTLYFIRKDIDLADTQAVAQALEQIDIQFKNLAGLNTTFLNDENVEAQIRQMKVSNKVSDVATISAVRRQMVLLQQKMGETKGIVMDGRDIGTVVFPNAALKIFLTASVKERTRRRYQELLDKGENPSLEAVQANLEMRDRIDSSRADSPLSQAEDAILIDNTNLTKEEQLAWVRVLVEGRV